MQKQQFGIMDQGYFVSKSEILAWINSLLQINITKIEALGSGSIYCQIFDVIHPGKINLSKVNWKARNDNQFLANFRLLQTACEKIGIKRHIEVEKLVKAKSQDNLQFSQWLKRYFDKNCGSKGQGYDAVEKRNKVVPDFSFCEKVVVPKVFNATGQIGPKQNKALSPNAKKEEIPPRVKSPKVTKTPVVTAKKTPVVPKKTQQKKQQEKKPEVKKVQEKKIEDKKEGAKKPVITKKPEQVKEVPVRPTTQKKPEEKKPVQQPKPVTAASKRPTTAVQPPKKGVVDKSSAQITELKQKMKQMTQKVDMIRQILISQDSADMKIQMIKEVVGIATEKPSTQQTVTISESQQKAASLQKAQEKQVFSLPENVSNVNEDLLISEEPQQQQVKQEQPQRQILVESQHQEEQQKQQDLLQGETQQDTPQEVAEQEGPQPQQPAQLQSNLLDSALNEEAQQETVEESDAPQEQKQPEQKPDLQQSQPNADACQNDDDDVI